MSSNLISFLALLPRFARTASLRWPFCPFSVVVFCFVLFVSLFLFLGLLRDLPVCLFALVCLCFFFALFPSPLLLLSLLSCGCGALVCPFSLSKLFCFGSGETRKPLRTNSSMMVNNG